MYFLLHSASQGPVTIVPVHLLQRTYMVPSFKPNYESSIQILVVANNDGTTIAVSGFYIKKTFYLTSINKCSITLERKDSSATSCGILSSLRIIRRIIITLAVKDHGHLSACNWLECNKVYFTSINLWVFWNKNICILWQHIMLKSIATKQLVYIKKYFPKHLSRRGGWLNSR